MHDLLRKLRGGDRRSVGRVDEVVAAVREDPVLVRHGRPAAMPASSLPVEIDHEAVDGSLARGVIGELRPHGSGRKTRLHNGLVFVWVIVRRGEVGAQDDGDLFLPHLDPLDQREKAVAARPAQFGGRDCHSGISVGSAPASSRASASNVFPVCFAT